ncbi:MAG: transketolase family protein [Deltaproteobacteria bacterium]|nr:transketolase family protein [Deltaproteobacteria bacterium]
MKATRDAYGDALVELGGKYKDVVALDADLAGSTRSIKFKKVLPDRFFDMGVAEASMVDISAGLALCDKRPYVSSFAVFITGRAFESVRQSIAYQKLPVVLCGSHGGVNVGEDGGSHQGILDIALMRTLPNMKVVIPADYNETYNAVLTTIDNNGPVYIRTSRMKSPIFTEGDFYFGKGKILKTGKDVTLVSCGFLVWYALEAAKILEKEGIDVSVIDMATVKPLDEDLVYDFAKSTKRMVTIEEHTIFGGLGSTVAEFLSENYPIKLKRIGMYDVFGESGSCDDLLCNFGFNAIGISYTVREWLKKL